MEKEIVRPTGIKATSYKELLKAVRFAMATGRKRAEEAVERERVRTAWEIGTLIDEHVLQHKEYAGYDQQVLIRLAKDLGSSRTELSYMLQFARAYPIFRHAEILPWSHHEALLAVNDPEKRKALAERVSKENWDRDRLRKEVKAIKGASGKNNENQELLPPAAPGKPGTYRVILAKAGPFAGELAMDLGFSNYYRPVGELSFKEGEIISVTKDGQGYKLSAMGSVQEALYTYESYIYEVLDGDTVSAVIDLGFGFVTAQTLRFRGIDAPELATRDGVESKAFLKRKLQMPGGGGRMADGKAGAEKQEKSLLLASGLFASPILIKTVKSDKYDRYLGDIFLPARSLKASAGGTCATERKCNAGPKDWVYLNNLLLEKGYAVRVRS